MNEEHRDALARVIDPDSWELFDDKRVKTDSIRDAIVSDSRSVVSRIIDSGLMAKLEWEPREYIAAQKRIMERTSRTGRCYSVEDGLDGYQKHDPRCPDWPDGHGGSTCTNWPKAILRGE